MQVIGFIGLGHMGNPMMQHLLQAGAEVYVHDVMPEMVKAATELGAKKAKDLPELAKACDVIITSVQTGDQVKQICLGAQGIFEHMQEGKLFIDCSSIDIVTTRALHEAAKQLNLNMLDAPVSGGVSGAKAATLTFMVGGEKAAYERALPILKLMGKKIVHAGIAGSGQAAKMCNNMLLGISMVGVCEAFNLAEQLGLDKKKFFEISSNASGQCWAMTSYCPAPNVIDNVPANKNYEPGFMAKMMLKDLRLAQHAASSVDASIPLGGLTTELYQLFIDEGFGEKDFSAVMQFIGKHT